MWGGVQVTSPSCVLQSMEEAEQVTSGQELLDLTLPLNFQSTFAKKSFLSCYLRQVFTT